MPAKPSMLFTFGLTLVVAAALSSLKCAAQDDPAIWGPAGPEHSILVIEDAAPHVTPANTSVDAGDTIDNFLTRLVLDSLPHTYTENKNWGKQVERWDGIKWRRDGLKISTNRRKKKVNHGIWRKYSTELLNPNEEFSVQVKNLRKLENGKTAFDVHCSAHLKIHARESKWLKGVQLYSFSAEGHTKVRLKVSCELGVTMNITKFPPDLIFQPVATDADLIIDDFRIDRISKAGGEFAQQMTKAARKVLNKKIKEKERKLVTKINRQLDKKKDQLTLSIADAVQSKFATQAKLFLPDDVQQAIDGSK